MISTLLKNRITLLVLFIFSLTSCTFSPHKVSDAVEINLIANISKTRKVNLSTVASTIDYCMLETNDKCLVGDGMFVHCSKEYVVTIGRLTRNNYACYVFERKTGAFIRQISGMGRGPNEFESVNGVFWDGEHEQICLGANTLNLFYNLDGTFSHRTNYFSLFLGDFIPFDTLYVGYAPNFVGKSTIRIAFYDRTGTLIDSIPEYRSWEKTQEWVAFSIGFQQGWLWVFQNGLYYKDIFCDTLYQIKDFALQPRYVFNTGSRAVPYEIQEGGRFDTPIGSTERVDRYEKYMVLNKIFEGKKYLFITFDYKQLRYRAIYDKTDDKLQILPPVSNPPSKFNTATPLHTIEIPFGGFENDLDGGLPFWPQQMISDKEMMCVFTAEELLALDKSKITNDKLKNVLKSIDEYSNPVVAIVTLK